MDKPTYQRAVTPTMDTNGVPSGSASVVRGKLLSYQTNQLRRGTNTKELAPNQDQVQTSQQQQQQQILSLQQSQEVQSQSQSGPVSMQQSPYSQRTVHGEMGIQGRSTGNKNGGAGGSLLSGPSAASISDASKSSMNKAKSGPGAIIDGADGSMSLPRFDLVPLVDDIPADGIIFARIRNNPESLVVFRSPEERLRNPERLNLDRRQLDMCPIMEQELRLRLLNFQNNNIRQIQNLENLPNLIFLDLYNNKLTSLEGPIASVKGLRVLMAGKNRISVISNLTALRKLDVLDLHSNDIKQIDGLQGLADLRVLNLAGNSIPAVKNLMSLQSLTELNLRRNVIEKVYELDKLPALQRVFLSHNLIANLPDLQCLFMVKFLIELSLDGNPMSEGDPAQYRAKIISGMPGLRHLDLKRVTDEERILAAPSKKAVEQELGWNESEDDAGALCGDADAIALRNFNMQAMGEDGAGRLGDSDFRGGDGADGGQIRGIAALARTGKVPSSHSLFDLELIGPTEKALVAVGDAWEWVQAKRLLVSVTEASLYHMKRNVVTSKFAANISWLPSLKCLRLFNNDLESLKDIDIVFEAFGNSLSLDHLCIMDNPICSLHNLLRAYIIVCMPSLKSFNDVEIKDLERQESIRTLEPVLRIHNLAISQQLGAIAPSTKGGQFGALVKPKTTPNQPTKRGFGTNARMVSGSGPGIIGSVADEQFIADLCTEISTTALRRRKFRSEFEGHLRESVKQIFNDTVLQLSNDRLAS